MEAGCPCYAVFVFCKARIAWARVSADGSRCGYPMKHIKRLIAFSLFFALSVSSRGQVSLITEIGSSPAGTGSPATGNSGQQCPVAGSVVSAVTGTPISKASVKFWRLPESSSSYAIESDGATTDSDGRFQTLVAAGRYAMSVTRNGYAKQTIGAAGPAKAASIMNLACDMHPTELRFLMTPQAVIAGAVVDEDNEPVANARVEAFSYHRVALGTRASAVAATRTDDLGRYRLFGLSPGRYYISARAQEIAGNDPGKTRDMPESSYVTTYYPGTNHAFAAVPIQVTGGQESEANLAISRVRTVHAAGKLLSDYRVNAVMIVAYPGNHSSWDPGERHSVEVDDKTGRWIIHGLQPGPYTFVCDRMDNGVRVGARMAVTIGTKNVDDLQITLNRYPDLTARVTVEGGGPVPPALKISLQPREAFASMGYGAAQPSAEGEFFLKATSPDLSDVMVSNLPSGYFVKSITAGGREISDTGIELGLGGSHRVDIVISPNGARLEGSVFGTEDKALAGATVVLFPDPKRRNVKSAYYAVTTDRDGRFAVPGIRPAEYMVVAWDALDSIDYTDPEALEVADKQGQTLELEEGGRKTVQLKVLPAASLLP